LVEAKGKTDKEVADLQSENARLRGILSRMRAEETPNEPSASLLKRVEAAVRKEEAPAPAKTDAKDIKALREEAAAISSGAPTEIPSTETLLKKVQSRLSESDTSAPPPVVPDSGKEEKSGKLDRTVLSGLSPFGTKKNKEKTSSEPRTYVVQPGDSLFRVAERFYGDSTQWKRIRDANKAGIDPDGRIRAGQIIVVP
jgi:nucleoid-associated protein YgaU